MSLLGGPRFSGGRGFGTSTLPAPTNKNNKLAPLIVPQFLGRGTPAEQIAAHRTLGQALRVGPPILPLQPQPSVHDPISVRAERAPRVSWAARGGLRQHRKS